MKIAISGQMGSGKSTIANLIKNTDERYKIYSFGQKVKDVAYDLFNMDRNFKDRSLLINIADNMRMIDPDVWAKYIIKQIDNHKYCIIDDLRFQNELDILETDNEWIYIVLHIDDDKRLERLKKLYPDNYDDHVKNMKHLSEKGELKFSNHSRTLHLDSDDSLENIKNNIEYFINKFK